AVRTDPDAPKHKGISMLMVDTRSPGFSLTPIHTLGGNRTNATFYENVRVPVSMRVGRENEGWPLITTQLDHERVGLVAPGPRTRRCEATMEGARATRTIDAPWVQLKRARARARLEVLELMCRRQGVSAWRGRLAPAESSAVKVFGSESFVQVYRLW